MDGFSRETTQLNTALFIDFDNIYINLKEQDKQAAERFATDPDRWLAWLERQLPINYQGMGFTNRRILIRRCYLNPNSFSEYRPHFIRSAFEVIDCPPLTKQGKTSTDIHIVMDMLEALNHKTYFHEFIILSGDADFTPVLLNLRKHARYNVMLSIGYSSPAYRASCDTLIKQSAFVENALGITYQEEEQNQNDSKDIVKAPAKLLKSIADRLYQAAASPEGIPGNNLPEIYKEFPDFNRGNYWLGFHSLRKLTQEVVAQRDDLSMFEDEDSWRARCLPIGCMPPIQRMWRLNPCRRPRICAPKWRNGSSAWPTTRPPPWRWLPLPRELPSALGRKTSPTGSAQAPSKTCWGNWIWGLSRSPRRILYPRATFMIPPGTRCRPTIRPQKSQRSRLYRRMSSRKNIPTLRPWRSRSIN